MRPMPKAPRRYLFGADFRKNNPMARQFLAPQKKKVRKGP